MASANGRGPEEESATSPGGDQTEEQLQALGFLRSQPEPYLPDLYGALIPGLGQIINRRLLRGQSLKAFLIAIGFWYTLYGGAPLLALLFWLYGMADAWWARRRYNQALAAAKRRLALGE